jgi:hypothetical protein
MSRTSSFIRDTRAATSAEFALISPLMVMILLGIIDVGRYAWELNQAEKATQIGARWSVATDMVASGLRDYSFAVSGGISQGTVVPQSAFPGVTCQSDGTAATCNCSEGGNCAFPLTANNTAFTNLVNKMSSIKSGITAQDVVIDYSWSGLGFSGDPNGPDVAPILTIRLKNQRFQPMITQIFDARVPLPSFAYSLTMEDGDGTVANY